MSRHRDMKDKFFWAAVCKAENFSSDAHHMIRDIFLVFKLEFI